MSAADPRTCRSWLFVPADSPRKLEKAWSTGADALILDLEDACPPDRKVASRALIVESVAQAGSRRGSVQLYIRVNALESGLTSDDIRATFACRPDGYVMPKVVEEAQIATVASLLQELERQSGADRTTLIVPIVTEHPAAVFRLEAIARADARVGAIIWGAEDLSAAIGASRIKRDDGSLLEVFATVRSLALLAGSAAGAGVIDGPYVELDDLYRLAVESREAAWMGFSGKLAIHPAQVDPINRAFTPDPAEVARAREIVEMAKTSGLGVFSFQGKMIDAPHVKAAERLLARVAARETQG